MSDFKTPGFEERDEGWVEDVTKAEGAFHDNERHPHDLVAASLLEKNPRGVLVGLYRRFDKTVKGNVLRGKLLAVAQVALIKWWAWGEEGWSAPAIYNGREWVSCHPDETFYRFSVQYNKDAGSTKERPWHVRMHVYEQESNHEKFSVLVELGAPGKEGKIVGMAGARGVV